MRDKILNYRKHDKIFYEVGLMYTEESCLITIGANRENLAKVLNSNLGVEKLFGYKREEL